MQKRCASCHSWKDSETEFYEEPRTVDGRSILCRQCLSEQAAGRKADKAQDTKGWYLMSPNGLRGSVLKLKEDEVVVHFKGSRTVTLPLL